MRIFLSNVRHFLYTPAISLISALGLTLALQASPVSAADTSTLKIGTATSPQIEALKIAAHEAKEQGLDVKIIEFTDWNTPNAALANKDIDVNYFQHIPFLENAKKQGGYNFVAIAPGTIDTPMPHHFLKDTPNKEQVWDAIGDRHMMKRFGRAEEVVAMALFLASDEASFMTGSVVTVDGGFSAF